EEDVGEAVETAFEARPLAAPELAHGGDLLAEQAAALVEGRPEPAELLLRPAGPEPEDQPPAGEDVDPRRLLRHEAGVALRQDDDRGAEPDALGAAGEVGERDERLDQPAVGLGLGLGDDDVVRAPERLVTERLRLPGAPSQRLGSRELAV